MFRQLLELFGLRKPESIVGPLTGLELRPFDNTTEEPYRVFSQAMKKNLTALGVTFSQNSKLECELDWEKMGGSQLKLRAAAQIDGILVTVDVREGFPIREVVDFDIEVPTYWNEEKKMTEFFQCAAEKICDLFVIRYTRDLGHERPN